MKKIIFMSLLFHLCGCGIGYAPTAYDACLDNIKIQCKCAPNPYEKGSADPFYTCHMTEEEEDRACMEYKSGDMATEAYTDWLNCGNLSTIDCDNSDYDCGDPPGTNYK